MELESWGESVLDATHFRAICFQPGEQKIWDVVSSSGKTGGGGGGGRGSVRKKKLESYTMSEDCLTLNIYVPLTLLTNILVSILEHLSFVPHLSGGGRTKLSKAPSWGHHHTNYMSSKQIRQSLVP